MENTGSRASSFSLSLTDTSARKTWHDRGHHYLFNFRQVGGVVARKTNRPTGRFVFSRLSRERKMMKVAHRKRDGNKKEERNELSAQADFLELLMARDNGKMRFCPPG